MVTTYQVHDKIRAGRTVICVELNSICMMETVWE